MMPRFLALVAITISVLSSIHASAIDMRATDRAALLSFKSGVWGNLSDWGSPQMCNWTGVTCDPRGLVIRLLLSNSNLTGVVSPAIGNLSALETLELHSNQLSGNIPPQLGMLSQLVNLSLDNNTLNGPIPETLGLLKNITYLSLSDNNLNGSIPEAIVCNCSSLSSIDLSNNSLTGEIILSTQCQPLSLNKLILYNNGLTGIIPSSMSNFTSLEWLLLQSNFLGSVLPSKMFNGMSSLKFLYLSNNNFSGDGGGANLEPFLASLVNCTCLEELGLDSNGMRDKIPPTIGNLSSTNLSKLYLYDNKITGTIPHTIGNISSLTDLCIEKNMLEGTIPSEIFQPRQLTRLVLANNQINGEIPKSIGLAQRLNIIHMSYNGLQGTLPDTLSNLTELEYLVLHHNQLSGAIPPGVSCSMILDLCYNKLTGRIPIDLAGPSTLQIYVNLSNNLLEGPLPLEFGNMDKIKALDLSSNKLSAAIPAQIKGCTALEYVNLSRNFLQGALPSSIGSFPTSLHVLDVSLNRLTGTIPLSLQTSPELWFANFSYNNFIGEVSSEGSFANLTADSFLDNPGLCGSILGMAPCRGKHGHFLYIAITVIIAIAAILLAMVCIFYHDLMKICLRLTPPSFQLSSIPTGLVNTIGEKEGDHPRISYRELVDATDGFSEANLIGKGGYGHVYRGVLHGGTVIAVKALHNDYVGEVIAGSFERECRVIRSIRHRNLIRVITACSTPEFKAIVLPFMPNGNLDSLIHGPPGGGKPEGPQHKLDLDMVLSIASNIAEGMAYLHHHAPVKVVHCDLKPSNVLLDGDMTAIVSDFGISKLVINGARDPEMGEASTSVVWLVRPAFDAGDVYSFGVMLLEMISGKRPTDVISEEGHGLHDWAKKRCLEHDLDAIVKCLLLHDSPSVQPFGLPGCEMEAVAVVMELLELGVACSQLAPSMRPDMDDVAHEIACVRDGTWRKYRATDLNAIGQKKFRE
ncbi:hypothetical protein HU200_035494 [Digitaria exilis]|uniref:Protein kinase domain-containing protein n=1 Tax=Digitaria exilis TaxID=1010633 RepID=A0A835EIY0_9POAL|nr:hypothetical protein HU200_035494 [Digitaria exilis]